MPFPKSPGHESILLEKIDECKLIRQHQEANPTNVMDNPGTEFLFGKKLGAGTFGEVWECMNQTTGEMVAIKAIKLNPVNQVEQEQQIAAAEQELTLMMKLRHLHVVSVKGSGPHGNNFCIIMELVSGSSLSQILEKIPGFHEKVVRKFTRQLLLALEYCHRNHCIHGDIKSANVLLTTDGIVKLADFGSAVVKSRITPGSKENFSPANSFTPLYAAPELILTRTFDEKIDIWSVGCLVSEMSTGKTPWHEKNFQTVDQLRYCIYNTQEIPSISMSLSSEARDFCKKALERNPEHRPSARELLKHPWIVGHGGDVSATASAAPSRSGSVASSHSSSSSSSTPGEITASELSRIYTEQMAAITNKVDSHLKSIGGLDTQLQKDPNAKVMSISKPSRLPPSLPNGTAASPSSIAGGGTGASLSTYYPYTNAAAPNNMFVFSRQSSAAVANHANSNMKEGETSQRTFNVTGGDRTTIWHDSPFNSSCQMEIHNDTYASGSSGGTSGSSLGSSVLSLREGNSLNLQPGAISAR